MSTPTKSFPFSPSPSCFSYALSPPRTLFPSTSLFSPHPFQKLNVAANSAEKSNKVSLHSLGSQDSSLVQINCSTLAISESSFVDSGIMLFALFREIGFNESDTEALLDSNPVVKLTPFDSIRTRIHSFQSLGGDLELAGKIKTSQIEHLFNSTEPRFLAGFEAKVRLLLQLGITQETIVHVLNNANLTKAFCLKSFEDIERILTFLNRFGGVDLILRRPALLNYDLDAQLIPRVGFLLELSGGDETGTATVLRKLPFVVAYSVDHLKDHVEFLKSFAGLSEEEIFRIVLVYPNMFSASRKRKLHPRIDFLKKCGLSSHDIFRFLIKAPLFLSLSFEGNLAYKLVFLVKIGYKKNTKELAMAMGAVTRTSCKNMQEVIGVFLNYGLTCDDILEMSMKHPQVLQYNHESLEEKMDYLVEEMGREVGELLAFPAFLGYKLDGRIKHRYEEKRKILGEGMSLNKLLSVSAARFSSKSKRKQRVPAINGLDESDD